MAGGRPAKFETREELEQSITAYFTDNPKKPTITGLALHLGFESRQSIYDYEKDGEFSYTIKKARLSIESKYEEKLHEAACTGAIFALKNFGWKDGQEINHKNDGGKFEGGLNMADLPDELAMQIIEAKRAKQEAK